MVGIGAIITTVVLGAFIGWLAGLLMKSKHGFLMCTLLGIVGSSLGGWIANILNLTSKGFIGTIFIQVAGTCILIAIVRAILGKKF